MGRAADQFAEKQDVFGVEIAVGQVEDNLRRFIGVVKLSGGGRGDRVEVQGQIVPGWWRAVLRRIARSVVPERVVVRAERLRTFRGLWVAQDFRARDFDSFPFLFDFFRLQTKPAGFENMHSVFADLRRGRLRSAAADGSEYDGHKKGCPYRATRHNKENNNLVSSRLLIGWGRNEWLHGGNRLRLALRHVGVETRTECMVRIKQKKVRSCEPYIPLLQAQ